MTAQPSVDRLAMDVSRPAQKGRRRWLISGVAVVSVIAITAAIASRGSPETSVDRSQLVIDSVRRGPMVREVVAAGTLVPERVRIIAAITAGRVEQLPVVPGSTVLPSTILVQLSNPDVQLEQLESERNLNATQAALVDQEGSAETQRLLRESSLAALETQLADAKRQLTMFEALDSSRLVAKAELAAARDKAHELDVRERLEREQLRVLTNTAHRQLALQNRQVNRLQAISQFHSARVTSMQVRAGESGVLQELPLQLGQWVNPGMLLARIAEPGHLKAVLRVPETQARDVSISQRVSVDTRNGIIHGHVVRVAPAAQGGTVEVEVALDEELPKGARAEQAIDGTIELERLPDVLLMGRPVNAQGETSIDLYRLERNGKNADRVSVQLGAISVNTVQVRRGLNVGDKIIVSDIGAADGAKRVRVR